MFKRSIKTNITAIFLFLVSIISLAIVYTQYYFNYNLAVSSTTKTFKLLGENILDEVSKSHKRVENILTANITNRHIQQAIIFKSKHSATEDFINILSVSKGIFSIYFAHADGSFYEIINMSEFMKVKKSYQAPLHTKWIVVKHKIGKTEYSFLDNFEEVIERKYVKKEFDPLARNWYKKALASSNVVMLEPYIFKSIETLGTTYAVQTMQKETVLGVDFTMQQLSEYLKIQKFDEHSEVFMFNGLGEKFVSSEVRMGEKPNKSAIAPVESVKRTV